MSESKEELYKTTLLDIMQMNRVSDIKELIAEVFELNVEEYLSDKEELDNYDFYEGDVDELTMELDF